jgi:hypothetical protein
MLKKYPVLYGKNGTLLCTQGPLHRVRYTGFATGLDSKAGELSLKFQKLIT